jgi:hypothetical protein
MPVASGTATCGAIPGSRVASHDSRAPLPGLMKSAEAFSGKESGRTPAASAQWLRATDGALSLGVRSVLAGAPPAKKADPRSRPRIAGPERMRWGRRARASHPCPRFDATRLSRRYAPLHGLCTLVQSALMLSQVVCCQPRRSRAIAPGGQHDPLKRQLRAPALSHQLTRASIGAALSTGPDEGGVARCYPFTERCAGIDQPLSRSRRSIRHE